MKRICLATLAIVFLCGCSPRFKLERGKTWNQPGHPSQADTSSQFIGKFDIKWEADFGAKVIAPLATGAGYVAVATSRDKIRFFDIGDGSEKGRVRVKGSAQSGLIASDTLFVTGSAPPRNRLTCNNFFTGSEKWRSRVKDIAGGSIITGNALIVTSGSGLVISFDILTGVEKWRYQIEGSCTSPPIVVGECVVQTSGNGKVTGIAMNDGTKKYDLTMPAPITSSIAIDSLAFVADIDGNVMAFDPSNGTKVWSVATNLPFWSSPSIHDDLLVVTGRNGIVIALSATHGDKLWQYDAVDVIKASAVIFQNHVVCGTLGGMVIALDAANGRMADTRKLDGPIVVSPCIATDNAGNSGVLVATDHGGLYCFATSQSAGN